MSKGCSSLQEEGGLRQAQPEWVVKLPIDKRPKADFNVEEATISCFAHTRRQRPFHRHHEQL
jgi:hypothetical protein